MLYLLKYTEVRHFFVIIAIAIVWHKDLIFSPFIEALFAFNSKKIVLPRIAAHLFYFALAVPILRIHSQGIKARGPWARVLANKSKALEDREFYGHSAVVTGASGEGIGFYNAQQLAAVGFRVILLCRNQARAEAAKTKILRYDRNADVHIVLGDVCELATLRTVAGQIVETAKAGSREFSLLVQNAGLFSPTKQMTKEGYDIVLQTNHMGPYVLGYLLAPHMSCNKPVVNKLTKQRWENPRIVFVGSVAHLWATKFRWSAPAGPAGYDSNTAPEKTEVYQMLERDNTNKSANLYGIAKACNHLLARSLQQRLPKKDNFLCCSVHPGGVESEIWRWIPMPFKLLADVVMYFIFKSPLAGSMTTLHCCLSETGISPGGYYADCTEMPASALVRDKSEIDGMEVWTQQQDAIKKVLFQ